jgi:hypothetical protein
VLQDDAANNYARGHHTIGMELVNLVLGMYETMWTACTAPTSAA